MRQKDRFGWWIVLSVMAVAVLCGMQNVQSIGVTRPVPYDIELMRGETAGFTFEIQAVTSLEALSCSYSISGLSPLTLTFEEDEVTVDAGSIKNVYGTVTVPANAEIKSYSGQLSVSCGALVEGGGSGSSVKTTVGGSPFIVKVVEVRSGEIRPITPPPAPPVDYTPLIVAVVVVIVVLIVLYYLLKARKRRK
jgi:hypothetical protein